jgi:hypothetical protein
MEKERVCKGMGRRRRNRSDEGHKLSLEEYLDELEDRYDHVVVVDPIKRAIVVTTTDGRDELLVAGRPVDEQVFNRAIRLSN